MADDNLYGAPAEGLGQNVTFQFRTPGGTPQLPSVAPVLSAARVIGGNPRLGTQGTGVREPGPNPVLTAISRLADNVTAVQLKKAQTANFFAGMQRVAQGEAAKDIVAGQPWYSQIFGESDVVAGARAYDGMTRANTVVTAMERELPNLRSMNASQAEEYYKKQIEQAQTGDAAIDMATLQTLTQTMPQFMKRQAKEHYAWNQEQAVVKENAAFDSAAEVLAGVAKGRADDTVTPEAYRDAVKTFVYGIQAAAGRDPEGYQKNMAANLRKWAQAGNLHALNALDDFGFSTEVLTAEQQVQVEKAREAGEGRLRNRYSQEWSEEVANIRALASYPSSTESTNDLKARIDALNGKYAQVTGSRVPLISPDQEAGYLAGSLTAVARATDKEVEDRLRDAQKQRAAALTQEEKDEAAVKEELTVAYAFMAGSLAYARGVAKSERDDIAYRVYSGLQDPANRVKALTSNRNYVVPMIQHGFEEQVQGAVSSENLTEDFRRVYQDYALLRSADPATADAYFGKYAKEMVGFHNSMRNGVPEVSAFRNAFITGPRRNSLDKASATAAVKTLVEDHSGIIDRVFGNAIPLKSGQAERAITEVSKDLEEWLGQIPGSVAEATRSALGVAKGNGLEILGGYVWSNSKGQQSIQDYLVRSIKGPDGMHLATDNVGYVLEQAISNRHREVTNEDVGKWQVSVNRMPDYAGSGPMLLVNAHKDGTIKNYLIEEKDFLKADAKRSAYKKFQAESPLMPFRANTY